MFWFAFLSLSAGMYIMNVKDIQVASNQFHLINVTAEIRAKRSEISHDANIFVNKILHDPSLYDVFLLDEQGFLCYMQRYYNSSWEQPCFFLSNSSQSFLLQSSFNTSFSIESDSQLVMIIDNTYFPQGGAFYNDALHLQTQFTEYVTPIPTYYNYSIKLVIVFVGFLIFFLIWCIVLVLKYKKELKHKERIQSIRTTDNLEASPQKSNPYKRFKD